MLPVLLALTSALGLRTAPAFSQDTTRGVLRVAVAARPGPHSTLSTLVYWGGFQTKTVPYEPLVRVGEQGELLPGLLESWTESPDERVFTLVLRRGVKFHDGTEVDALALRDHLQRWRGNPAGAWLGSTERMKDIEIVDERTVRVSLSEPWNFLRDAIAINPGYLMAPGAFDNEGTFQRTVGTGPYKLIDQVPNRSYTFLAHDQWWQSRPTLQRVHLVSLSTEHREADEVLRTVLTGDMDLVADGEGHHKMADTTRRQASYAENPTGSPDRIFASCGAQSP